MKNHVIYNTIEIKNIINLWYKNVYNKKIVQKNILFSGCCGHQLELLFGLKPNNKNQSDFINFELKQYSSKITFGDWKGSFLFEVDLEISRLDFLKKFGTYNNTKKKYYFVKPAIPTFPCISLKGYFWEIIETELKLQSNVQNLVNKKNISLCVWNLKQLEIKFMNKFSGNILLAKKKKGVHKSLIVINKLEWFLFLKLFKKGIIYLDPCLSSSCARNRSLFRVQTTQLLNILGYTEYYVCSSSQQILNRIVPKDTFLN